MAPGASAELYFDPPASVISSTSRRSLGLAFSLIATSALHCQIPDRTLSSTVGGALGGLSGLIVTLPAACGGLFTDRKCVLSGVVKGFAVGNVLGTTLSSARSAYPSSCSRTERYGRSFFGSVAGAGIGVAAVSRAHGNLRIGLSPLVQVASAFGAATMVSPCFRTDDSFSSPAMRSGEECRNPSRNLARAAAGLGLTGGYAGLYLYFHHAWWSGTPAKNWFVENDWDQLERDVDKFGHFFGGYQLTRVTSELLRAGCMDQTRASLVAALYAYAFQFQIEEWDGTQQMYGFSPPDLIADAAGAAFAVAQQRSKALQAIKPVWSYTPTESYRRRNEPGHAGQPRATTDYAGQTYWFSTDVNALLPDRAKPFWPALIRFSPGYSITDYVDPRSGAGIRAKRRIFVSLDLDTEHLPGDNKVWRTIKHELSFLRIPGPTLQLAPNIKFIGARY